MKTKINLNDLVEAVAGLKYHEDGSGVLMAFQAYNSIPLDIPKPLFEAITEIRTAMNGNPLGIMVNIVPPGLVVPKHRDFLNPIPGTTKTYPIIHRFHLPILTNEQATWWDETKAPNERFHMPLGMWCGPVRYWKLHDVQNLGTSNRVHLVVDLDILIEGEKYDDR